MFYVVGAHGFQHVIGCNRILFQILARMLGAEAHIGIGGEVEDKFCVAHSFCDGGQVKHITVDKLKIWILDCGGNKFLLTRGEIVVAGNDMTFCQQAVCETTANETGAAGDEVMHDTSMSLWLFLRICT